MRTKQARGYLVYTCELDGPNHGAILWDNGGEKLEDRWYGPITKAKMYLNYRDAWNSLQAAYSANRNRLNKRTYGIIEVTPVKVDDTHISPALALTEYMPQIKL
jgi:hypothetical protein